jgi:protein gp37
MADKSAIEWTDATVNFWWGCTKVGPGCDHCYAETWDARTGGAHWGHGVPRRKIKSASNLIHRLNGDSIRFADEHDGRARRVFIQSMSDLFDLEVPHVWFAEAWAQIETCICLDIQIVTKRVTAVEKRLSSLGRTRWPKHAGLMITVVNQAEADRDIPRLLALKAKFGIPWVGLSIEPMLGPVDLTRCGSHYTGSGPLHLWRSGANDGWHRQHMNPPPEVEWVIVGGESGKHARPLNPDWVRNLHEQCVVAGVPFLFKQWGRWLPMDQRRSDSDIHEKRQSIAVFGDGSNGYRDRAYDIGKKAAGRLLDGVTHDGFPEARA